MFDIFHQSITKELNGIGITKDVNIFQPPKTELGDFCFVVNQISGKRDPSELAEELETILANLEGIDSITQSTQGNPNRPTVFLNFTINEQYKLELQENTIRETLAQVYSKDYGYLTEKNGKTAVVEHTSANPISTLHVGNLRNSVQGDTFARILERMGYTVYRHFYVNDVGLQISFVVIGYELVKEQGLRPPIKIDLWLGQVYALMNCFYNIQKLKKQGSEWGLTMSEGYQFSADDLTQFDNHINQQLSELNSTLQHLEQIKKLSKRQKSELRELKFQREKISDILSDVRKYDETYGDLQLRFPQLFSVLVNKLEEIDLIDQVAQYLKHYEKNTDVRITDLFREVVEWNIQAFKWTLNRYNIDFDKFDYESDLTWSGLPDQIIDQLAGSANAQQNENAIRYSYPKETITKFCKATEIPKSELPIKGNIPDLQLRRSDGTALYAAKDIAYSIQKFKDRGSDLVYNVISAEQILPQFQLLVPLYELGMTDYAKGLKHYSYELVELRGRTMSGRLAQYVTADEYYDETFIRARMAKRQADAERNVGLPSTKSEWKVENETLRAVTLASTRFPLIETAPNRRIELDLDRELDFRRNAGPFVEYAHARCASLMAKVKHDMGLEPSLDIDYSLLAHDDIVAIIQHLQSLPDTIRKAADQQDPSQIANWCINLAQSFMKFYENYPILRAETEQLAQARLTMVEAIRRGLFSGLEILGIPAANQL